MLWVCLAPLCCTDDSQALLIRLRKLPIAKAGWGRDHMILSNSEAEKIDHSGPWSRRRLNFEPVVVGMSGDDLQAS